jgi:hypothetical protein
MGRLEKYDLKLHIRKNPFTGLTDAGVKKQIHGDSNRGLLGCKAV